MSGNRRHSGLFAASRNRAIRLLTDLELVAEVNDFADYSLLVPSEVRSKTYSEVWKKCLQEQLYDVRLVDESIIQFNIKSGHSYSFYDAPVRAIAFSEYVLERLDASIDDDAVKDLLYELRDEYDSYVSGLDYQRPALPVRYDYSPDLYRSPCHPASHVHFGFSTDVRVATRRQWLPETFTLFLVRQFYPHCYEKLVAAATDLKSLANPLRSSLELIADQHWDVSQDLEIHLA